ncbi:MAG TPA: hypothetical protein VFF48_12955 [Brevundimonas sp.]|nr:hypothetical protein [Brevundimonas sp.]
MTPPLPREASWLNVLDAARRVGNRIKTRRFARNLLSIEQQADLDRLLAANRLKGFDAETAVSILRAVFENAADDAFMERVAAQLTPLCSPDGEGEQ